MQQPSKSEIVAYVADMAEQLATFVRPHLPAVAIVLEIAAAMARGALSAGD